MKKVVLDIKYDRELGEYSIPWIENGKLNEARTYYTDSLEDARGTLVVIIREAQNNGYEVRIKGNRFMAGLGVEGS